MVTFINDYAYNADHMVTTVDNKIRLGNLLIPGAYSEVHAYDLAGNITSIQRNAITNFSSHTVSQIDNLAYIYQGGSSRLQSVSDAAPGGSQQLGYKPGSSTFSYDNAGNIITESGKQLGIQYNPIDLPQQITTPDGNIYIDYTFGGEKLQTYDARALPIPLDGARRWYMGAIEFKSLGRLVHHYPEGRIVEDPSKGGHWREYTLQDHLGNTVVTYSDLNANGKVDANEALQHNYYYAFGEQGSKAILMALRRCETEIAFASPGKAYRSPDTSEARRRAPAAKQINGNWQSVTPGSPNKYLYNGKELHDWAGLNWGDYGARWYMPELGRFTGVDPIASKFPHANPYNYAENEPIGAIDLWGLQAVRVAKVQQRLMTNIRSGTNLNISSKAACYPAAWMRVAAAYKDAGLTIPAGLNNKGAMFKDNMNSNTGRWYPTGNSNFNVLASSNFQSSKWSDLPEKYRGEGLAGAMAHAGYADDPQDAWGGGLQEGAILQMWNSPSDYEGVKSGEGYDNYDANSWVRWGTGQSTTDDGHSAIFTGYKKNFMGMIIGINYVDQKGEQSISRWNPKDRIIRGANLKDKKGS